MDGAISRLTYKVESVAITTALGTTKAIPFAGYAGGRIYIPTGAGVSTLTFYDSTKEDGVFLASYDDAASPAAITLTVSAAKSYPIPAKLFGAGAIKIVGDAAVTAGLVLKG